MGHIKSMAAGFYLGIAAVGFTALAAHTAEAALVGVDLAELAGSDTFLTRDTATGLDWLDVNLTTGLSHTQIVGGTVINNLGALQGLNPITGAAFAGNPFRHATSAELRTLYENAGIPDIFPPTTFSEANFAPIADLQALVGITFVTGGFQSRTGGFLAGFGSSIPGFQDAGTLTNCSSALALCAGSPPTAGSFQSGEARHTSGITPTQASIASGHWLVRNSTTAAIPEPGTLAVLGLGLVGLGLVRRRRAA